MKILRNEIKMIKIKNVLFIDFLSPLIHFIKMVFKKQ